MCQEGRRRGKVASYGEVNGLIATLIDSSSSSATAYDAIIISKTSSYNENIDDDVIVCKISFLLYLSDVFNSRWNEKELLQMTYTTRRHALDVVFFLLSLSLSCSSWISFGLSISWQLGRGTESRISFKFDWQSPLTRTGIERKRERQAHDDDMWWWRSAK